MRHGSRRRGPIPYRERRRVAVNCIFGFGHAGEHGADGDLGPWAGSTPQAGAVHASVEAATFSTRPLQAGRSIGGVPPGACS